MNIQIKSLVLTVIATISFQSSAFMGRCTRPLAQLGIAANHRLQHNIFKALRFAASAMGGWIGKTVYDDYQLERDLEKYSRHATDQAVKTCLQDPVVQRTLNADERSFTSLALVQAEKLTKHQCGIEKITYDAQQNCSAMWAHVQEQLMSRRQDHARTVSMKPFHDARRLLRRSNEMAVPAQEKLALAERELCPKGCNAAKQIALRMLKEQGIQSATRSTSLWQTNDDYRRLPPFFIY